MPVPCPIRRRIAGIHGHSRMPEYAADLRSRGSAHCAPKLLSNGSDLHRLSYVSTATAAQAVLAPPKTRGNMNKTSPGWTLGAVMTLALVRAATNGVNWTAVGALAACATVVIYVVLGLFAWRQVGEARKLREEQARPFVIVDFEPGFLVYLTVENLGRTMARNVSIHFDQPLESTLQGPRELDDSPLFREQIPALPPGKKIRVLFDQFNDRLAAGLPLTSDVKVRYRGPTGRKEWTYPYRLDLGLYLGSQPEKGIPDLVAEVVNLRKEIEKWKDSGILVHAIDQRRQDRITARRMNAYILRQHGRKAFARSLWEQVVQRYGLRLGRWPVSPAYEPPPPCKVAAPSATRCRSAPRYRTSHDG